MADNLLGHTQAHADKRPRSAVNADALRNIKFRKGIYDQSDVNELLGRIASEIDAGRRAGRLIANAAFHQRSIRGYDARAVDWFLVQLQRHEDPDAVARINADPWRELAADPYHIHRDPEPACGGHEPEPCATSCAQPSSTR